jgi:DNA replication factor GINS
MYKELFEIWKREKDDDELTKLPPNFYFQVADYMRRLREEERMIDKKTLKASLLKIEMHNAKHIVRELAKIRYQKLIRFLAMDKKIPLKGLTVHERDIFAKGSLPPINELRDLVENALRGCLTEGSVERAQKMAVVRFLKEVPAIIGADMKAYGPFKCEDVASLPFENVKILIKQKLVEKIEA